MNPDPNMGFHGRSVRLEDVTFVHQPNEAMIYEILINLVSFLRSSSASPPLPREHFNL